MKSKGYNRITDLTQVRTLAYGMAGGQPGGAYAVLLQAEGAAVRWRDDGQPPTATIGFLLNPGDVLYYDETAVSKIQVVAAATGAILNVSFYAEGNV